MKKISVCIPVYNNEHNIENTIEVILNQLDFLKQRYELEIIMVDDGSQDDSFCEMNRVQKKYPNTIRIGKLTRNFGQGACTNACMNLASGDIIGTIAADLQTPAEVLVEMILKLENGYDFVFASRNERNEKGLSIFFSKITHSFIHSNIDRNYPKGGFDFCVMKRRVLDNYLKIDIIDSFGQLKLLFLGYRYCSVEYIREERTIGKSGWNFGKKLDVFERLCTNYTNIPIRYAGMLGGLITLVSLILLLVGICSGAWDMSIRLELVILMVMGFLITLISLIGLYIWNIILYVRRYPQYIMDVLPDIIED